MQTRNLFFNDLKYISRNNNKMYVLDNKQECFFADANNFSLLYLNFDTNFLIKLLNTFTR